MGVAIGVAWVAALGGAYLSFIYLLPMGLIAAISGAMLGLVPGFVIVVFLECAKIFTSMAKEQKRQTALLETIVKSLSDQTADKPTQ
ncbi:hypothetical protein AGMMS50229_12240 [Campylobacterota bacterium]|nr:hypothetical protein AGMMS50229_12240 [Campylobacterota bacterium]